MISLNQVSKKYKKTIILKDVSLIINQGECIVIRGSNGSGKSTLLQVICGLIPMTSGSRIETKSNLTIGYTPDHLPVLRMTSTEYLTHIGQISAIPSNTLHQRITDLHTLLNLSQNETLKLTQFSKGMLQKVNLMQSILKQPDLLVLDEPFSGLDEQSREHIMNALIQIKAGGTAILASLHHPLDANEFVDNCYWLQEGRLIKENNNKSEQERGLHYQLDCVIDDKLFQYLINKFPGVNGELKENGSITFVFMKENYRSFILELMDKNVEIISLIRKEARV